MGKCRRWTLYLSLDCYERQAVEWMSAQERRSFNDTVRESIRAAAKACGYRPQEGTNRAELPREDDRKRGKQ
jgi:hypothetical protein